MGMDETLDAQLVAQAKAFWAESDVDHIFDALCEYLSHLKYALQNNSASDREYVQGLNIIRLLESAQSTPSTPGTPSDSFVQVVVGSEVLSDTSVTQLPAQETGPSLPISPLLPSGLTDSPSPPAVREDFLAPLPIRDHYQAHNCTMACLPSLPKSTIPFWGQNPLKVPLQCGFQRLSGQAVLSPLLGDRDEEAAEEAEGASDLWRRDVVYKAPCGLSLLSYDDVMHFLLATKSYNIIQMDFFSFNPAVCLDTPQPAGPRAPEQDLSRGTEPTPVELCPGEGGVRPEDFRYRKDRWPHGCFLGRGPSLFDVCCDCTDGCLNTKTCPCVNMTTGGRHYSHQRLTEPISSGLYECGPWCGCDRALCQNRLVQRGIRVRLQVFQTSNKGWGVRCRDYLDAGTFVCTYAGLVLWRNQGPEKVPLAKRQRTEQLSDDEVEVVTEWLALPIVEGQSNLIEPSPPTSSPTSPPLHVPVIQRPVDSPQNSHNSEQHQDEADEVQTQVKTGLVERRDPESSSLDGSVDQWREQKRLVTRKTVLKEDKSDTAKTETKTWAEDMCYLDASRQGNVGRFINHSCEPNLFVQNVFTDCHDPAFPVVAFFTSRAVKAGTELTWNYCPDPESTSGQEVPCHCGSDHCGGRLVLEEKICNVCEEKENVMSV
ncbi:histone-lysine N-methyltransferase SETDB2 [Lampris incognitus]|uniref:histone-lysine N-methyltransferase SETDB2 n=1 Tax=Lampris incognitus TaxID=2546036 RepID=UPI0024B5962A|nr:histone-lysine N-methyltransferase SETDB2 [Lampris incognitus]